VQKMKNIMTSGGGVTHTVYDADLSFWVHGTRGFNVNIIG